MPPENWIFLQASACFCKKSACLCRKQCIFCRVVHIPVGAMHFSVGKCIALQEKPCSTVCSEGLRIMNGSFVSIRDGPNTTTTIIFPKSFASDATPKRHLMAHQMKHLCVFSVFHCVEGAFGASSGATPKMKNGAPRDELKNGRGRGWVVSYSR